MSSRSSGSGSGASAANVNVGAGAAGRPPRGPSISNPASSISSTSNQNPVRSNERGLNISRSSIGSNITHASNELRRLLASPLRYDNTGSPSAIGEYVQSPQDYDLSPVAGSWSPPGHHHDISDGSIILTPVRQRPDINADSYLRQVNLSQGQEPSGPELVIWGTNVSASAFSTKFKEFIKSFTVLQADEDETALIGFFDPGEPLYMYKLHEIHLLGEPFLNINCSHLQNFDADMYSQLVCYPQEVIPTMDMAVNELFSECYANTTLAHTIQVRPFNAEKTKTMRLLNPEDIDQLVTISGMVIRESNIMPEMREGYFKCSICSFGAKSEIDCGKIIEPTLCTNCNTTFSFSLIHNRSTFVDKQMIRLQEDLEDTPVGETPYMAAIFAHGNLVNSVQPGDRITVTGIYRAAPFRLNPSQRSLRAVYKTHVDVIHFRQLDEKRLRDKQDGKKFTLDDKRVALIHELSLKPDIYERLAHAVAPSIYEHEDVKKGILLQLFGGTNKDEIGKRAEMHILLCGDPGTSKSQLLKYVHDLVPRSQYTSGKGSSAVGLTAFVTKDPETRQLVLQTGALVLADNGVCCIDEFDKMSDATRSILHEVMEQQTLSIAKAGIICQLNARTSVLAAANPVESNWNPKKSIIENVNLPHTLLSRFDLIFLLLDKQDDTFDRRLAKHMISLYFQKPEEEDADLLDMSVLRDYIAYAKEKIQPRLSEEAQHLLVHSYVEMRKNSAGRGTITAYPRQLESLIRLSEAHAKVRLCNIVEKIDVEEALRIHREAMKQSATDPLSGRIDVSILTTGLSGAERQRRYELSNTVKKALQAKGRRITINIQNFLEELKERSARMITKEMLEDVLKDLQDEGFLSLSGKTVRLCQH